MGYSVPRYDIKTQERLWVIDGKEYTTKNIYPNVPININGRIINCAKTTDIMENYER